MLPKLKTQKFKNITKRDTTLPSNLDNRRTFFQGCQVSTKRPQRVSPSRSIELGPFSSSFHSMTSSLNPWKAVDLKMVFGCVVSEEQDLKVFLSSWLVRDFNPCGDWWARSWGNLGVRDFYLGDLGFCLVRNRHVSGKWLVRAGVTNSGTVDIILLLTTNAVCHISNIRLWSNGGDKNGTIFLERD